MVMEQRILGRSGITASRLGLGTATFGREISEDESFRIMDYAFEHGIRLFDTAEAYGGGQARQYRKSCLGVDDVREVSGELHSSEKIVGRWLNARGVRKDVVLLTKVTTNHTIDHVREALAASLERLQTAYADLYLYHSHDAGTPAQEAVAAMNDVLASGCVRAGGVSNYSGAQLEAALRVGRAFEVIESNYNLAVRDIESDLLPLCGREQIGVITYSPLGAGFLTGKYTPDRSALPKGTRFDVIPGHCDVYFSETNFGRVRLLQDLSESAAVPVARLATAWVLQNPQVDVVLIGARTQAHLDTALAAMDLDFRSEWLDTIRAWG
jgi:aryl-alcohol dehydrogenase-like predicted oxidoreductase